LRSSCTPTLQEYTKRNAHTVRFLSADPSRHHILRLFSFGLTKLLTLFATRRPPHYWSIPFTLGPTTNGHMRDESTFRCSYERSSQGTARQNYAIVVILEKANPAANRRTGPDRIGPRWLTCSLPAARRSNFSYGRSTTGSARVFDVIVSPYAPGPCAREKDPQDKRCPRSGQNGIR
jgi:hypothetical protein